MNKKKINIVLIPLVVLLWILIIFRIIGYTRPFDSDNISTEINSYSNSPTVLQDTIVLYANYRDPFSNSSYPGKKLNIVTNSKINPIIKLPAIKPNWPPIEYGGTICNSHNDTMYAIIRINNKSELMTSNDELSGMKILQLNPDSVQIKLQNEIKTFKKVIK